MGGAYTIPSPNIPLSINFLLNAIWSPHSTGIGRTTTHTSSNRLKIPRYRSSDFSFPHVPPGMTLFQLYANGRHIKTELSMVLTKKARLNPCTT